MDKFKEFLQKNKKVVIAVVIVLIIFIILAIVLATGNKENNGKEVVSNVSTETIESVVATESKEDTKNYLEDVSEAPEDIQSTEDSSTINKNDAIAFDDGENDSKTSESSSISNETTSKTTSNSKSVSESKTNSATNSTINSTTNSGEQNTSSSTTSSSSSEASSESVSDNSSSSDTSNTPSNDTPSSGDIIYNGSVTLPSLGISIVCPNQYVSSGLTYNDILNNANAFTNAANNTLGDAQGMTWNGNAYGFYVMGYNSTPQSQIKYNGDGTYTLIIGSHFGGGYHAYVNGIEVTSMNADAILCEIATMSSTPQSVYNGIYDMFYGATGYDGETWYTFGDCKVKYQSGGYYADDGVSQVLTIKKA